MYSCSREAQALPSPPFNDGFSHGAVSSKGGSSLIGKQFVKFSLYIFLLCTAFCPALTLAGSVQDSFESGFPGLSWVAQPGYFALSDASLESRLSGMAHPTSGTGILRVAADGDSTGVHLVLAGDVGQDMDVRAWVFCEGNDEPVIHGGYQALVARASNLGSTHFVRLAWDPDYSESTDNGDGWVKLQAYDGTTWDYLGIDFSQFGASTPGYILNGTAWASGWHLFRLVVEGTAVRAFVDDMQTPRATGTLSVSLRDGKGGFYVYSAGDYAGLFDDFSAAVTPAPTPTPTPVGTDFDILIRNGEVYPDGYSGPLNVDVGIVGDRIIAVGDLSGSTALRVIDATGLTVTPGFIDVHTHADSGGPLTAYIRQGVTTVVAGNCGGSPGVTNYGSFLDSLAGTLGPNYAGLVGHNSLRSAVGLSGTTPTLTQMNRMKSYLDDALEAGAFGLSTGLIYATGYNSTTDEVIELARILAPRDALYATHMRSESEAVLEAVDEAIRIGHEAGCRVEISHVKCAGPAAWEKVDQFIARVDAANAAGDHVRMDQYPYTASQTTLNVLLPTWALNNWSDAVANHRVQLEADVRALIEGRGGADRVYIVSGTYTNRYLSEVASSLGRSPENVMIDDIGPGGGSAVYHWILEDDIRTFMPHPDLMIGSDGPTGAHPRGSGTFPRFWGRYVRELGLCTPREAVRKTSTLAAEHFRFLELQRGRIASGFAADVTVFDYNTILDRSTYESPGLTPVGVRYVLINGTLALDGGSLTGRNPGVVLRLPPVSEGRLWMVR